MSTGGKYIMETYYRGKEQDNFLLNIKLLKERLQECKYPILNNIPTHENYIKKYYKPNIPISYEFRSEITDPIQFGANTFSLQMHGNFICEIIFSCRIEGLSTINPTDKCAYVDFLGHKLIDEIIMDFAGNIVDRYTGDAYNIYYNYFVPDEKKNSWLRSVGQEVPEEVYMQNNTGQRELKYICDGPQTLKQSHDAIELNIPIIFDFTRKLHNSFFSSKVPFGQRFLKVNLKNAANICYGTGPINLPTITGKLIVNQIFIAPEIVQKITTGTYKTFIRVFKESKIKVVAGPNRIKLDDIRFPVEHLFFGVRPTTNTGPTTWWRYHIPNATTMWFPAYNAPNQIVLNSATYYKPEIPMENIKFTSLNTEVVNEQKKEFYSYIQPLIRGRTPQDIGLCMYSFAKHLDIDECTGYFNTSIERNFFIHFNSAVDGELYIVAQCLNWLEISTTGEVSLKYPS